MKRALLLIGLLLGGTAWPGPTVFAAEAALRRAPPLGVALPVFPRSERAEAVWASGGCWTACGSHTTWALAACLAQDAQGRCLKRADRADRACQRACRTQGGPYLPLDF